MTATTAMLMHGADLALRSVMPLPDAPGEAS